MNIIIYVFLIVKVNKLNDDYGIILRKHTFLDNSISSKIEENMKYKKIIDIIYFFFVKQLFEGYYYSFTENPFLLISSEFES